ncbi:hypothetical protein JI750_07435, partial [Flavobacterium sp. GN10]
MKKDLKKPVKSIAEAEKGSTFAPATAKNALRHSGSFMIIEGRNSQKKKIKKSLREKKKLFTFAPRKTRKVPWQTGKKNEKMRRKKSFKNF